MKRTRTMPTHLSVEPPGSSAERRAVPASPTIPAMRWELAELNGAMQSFIRSEAALRETRRVARGDERSAEPAAPHDRIGCTIGSYEVKRVLGEGGMGTVYLAEHTLVHARVAIKVLHDKVADGSDHFERFVREARAANAIDSPHVVPVIDFGRLPDGRPYAVMEHLIGQSLDGLLRSAGRLPLDRVADICEQIASGMAAAHREGILHRDLKPENLFVEERSDAPPRVRILDFGIAKVVHESGGFEPRARLTQAGFLVGTPLYCSPEQAAGSSLGEATDIYSMGAIAYELLSGRPAFDGTPFDVLVQKTVRDPPSLRALLPDLAPAAAALVTEMLARDPSARPRSMREVAERWAEVVALDEASASPTRIVRRTPVAMTLAMPQTSPNLERPRESMWTRSRMGTALGALLCAVLAVALPRLSDAPVVRARASSPSVAAAGRLMLRPASSFVPSTGAEDDAPTVAPRPRASAAPAPVPSGPRTTPQVERRSAAPHPVDDTKLVNPFD